MNDNNDFFGMFLFKSPLLGFISCNKFKIWRSPFL